MFININLLTCFHHRFHLFNCTRHSDYTPPGIAIFNSATHSDYATHEIVGNKFEIFARTPPDSRAPRGWLVDLLNKYVSNIN